MASPTSPAALSEPAEPSKGEATRARVIEAAHALFLKQGFHGTSMRAIADKAGLAVGGIYNHFGTKEEIFAAVLDANHPYHLVLPTLEETQGETVEAFVRDAARRFRVGLDGAETRLLPLMFMELVEFQGRHIRSLANQLLPPLLAFLQKLQTRRGRLRNLPLPVLLRALFGLLVGHLITDMILRGLKHAPALKGLEDYPWFDATVDIYLHGILAEEEPAA